MRCLSLLAAVLLVAWFVVAGHAAAASADSWSPRVPAAEAAAEAELAAVRCAAELHRVDTDRLTAFVEAVTPAYVQVRVETVPEREEDFFKVYGYRISDGRIIAEDKVSYAARPSPESVAIAREVAEQAMQGIRSHLPNVYNGRVFTAQFDGKCLVIVSEQDETGVRFRHRFNMCGR